MRRAAVFTLKCDGVAGGWLSQVFLWQCGDKTLERQKPRQKTREPSAGEAPLLWSILCHSTMTEHGIRQVNGGLPARSDLFQAVAERHQ